LLRPCGKEIQNDEREENDDAEQGGDKFGETVNPIEGEVDIGSEILFFRGLMASVKDHGKRSTNR